MTSDEYLWNILVRERVDISVTSPVRAVMQTLMPTLRGWGNQYLAAIHPSGSFAKGTANASGTDIDIFVSVRADVPNTLKEIYDTLCSALTQTGYSTRKQNVSIGIKVGSFDVDLIPAKRQSNIGDDHSLYRRRADTWTKTNVAQHIQLVANSGRTNEVRVLKLWRDQKGLDFPSFYLELTVIEALRGATNQSLSANIIRVLSYLQNSIANARFVDPANSNNIVSDDLAAQGKQAIAAAAATSLKSSWENCIQ